MAVTHGQATSHPLATISTVLHPHGELGMCWILHQRGVGSGEGSWGEGEACWEGSHEALVSPIFAAGWDSCLVLWQQDVAGSPLPPQGGEDGLTGGPWGPGGPGVCEEQVQAEGKAGQVSPSF